MELFLNLTWMIVATTTTMRCVRWSFHQSARRRPVVATATVCILALLFPIISLTDDLHNDATVPEETRAARRVPLVITAQPHTPVGDMVADMISGLHIDALSPPSVCVVADDAIRARDGFRCSPAIRPPPCSLA